MTTETRVIELPTEAEPVRVVEGHCLELLKDVPPGSIDAVVCDPPYPCIKRSYGYWTEAEWFALMDVVVPECRRVLKPTGSAVFVLQPNSERVGRMRPWLFEFQAKWCREWGMVQDAWWWNTNAIPEAHSIQGRLMRTSLKACVWLGSSDCFRDQRAVRWSESDENKKRRLTARVERIASPSGHGANRAKTTAGGDGGVTPYNVLPMGQGENNPHPGSTPSALCRWWVRYICPPGGTVLDPFLGSGTVALAALAEKRRAIGFERIPEYAAIARARVAKVQDAGLFAEV